LPGYGARGRQAASDSPVAAGGGARYSCGTGLEARHGHPHRIAAFGTRGTARNWNTVLKLPELAGDDRL
jgi:hypothetical protein